MQYDLTDVCAQICSGGFTTDSRLTQANPPVKAPPPPPPSLVSSPHASISTLQCHQRTDPAEDYPELVHNL